MECTDRQTDGLTHETLYMLEWYSQYNVEMYFLCPV